MKGFLIVGAIILVCVSGVLATRAFRRGQAKRAQILPSTGIRKDTAERPNAWRRQPVPLEKSADIIVFGNDELTVIAGTGTILTSRNDGETWEVLSTGQGDLRITTDGGATYTEVRRDSSIIKANDLCNVESAVIGPSSRLYLKSVCEHTAQIWSVPIKSTSEPWHVVSFTYESDPSNGVFGPGSDFIIAGDKVFIEGSTPSGAAILTSEDNGSSWKPFWKASFFGAGLSAFDFLDQNTGWILLSDGELRRTSDGGRSWATISTLPHELVERVYSLKFTNMSKAFVVGSEGLILTTSDGGITWQRQDSRVSFNLYKVSAADPRHAWATGNSSVVLETFDGGTTWETVKLDIKDHIFHKLSIKNGEAFVCSDKSIFRSF
jgi:photosystem II stability/assembly factor-like uncharacterized protein